MREGRIEKRNYDDLDKFAIESQGRRSKSKNKFIQIISSLLIS
jgi:hypothetical protein